MHMAGEDDVGSQDDEGYPWVFSVGLLAALVTFALWAGRHGFSDFGAYHAAAVRLSEGLGIYANPEGTLPFTYPPAAAYLLSPLALLPSLPAGHLFTLLSLVALGRAAFLMTQAALPSLDPPIRLLSAAVVPAALLTAEPSHFTIVLGQVNFFLLWLVCEDTLGRPGLPRGVLTGIATALKLTPAVFIVAWAVAGRWRTAAISAGTFAATVALGFILAPTDSTRFWSDLVRDVDRVGVVHYAHNQSINATIRRVLGEEGNVALWFVLSLAVGLVGLFLARRLIERGDRLGFVAVMGLVMTLTSPISWGHHWVWAYPAVLWLVGGLWTRRPHPVLLLTAVPVFWGRLVHLMPQGDDVELEGPLFVRVLQSPYVYWALAFLVTVLVAELRDGGRRTRVEVESRADVGL